MPIIRPARAADKESVLAFTAHTWHWGDYLSYVWDEWLAGADSELSVAELEGQVVAVTMTKLLATGEGWLQGLRVHPDHRRHGLARLLTAYQIDWLRQRKARLVRLAVHCHNLASQSHVAQTGFSRLATFAWLEQPTSTVADADLAVEAVSPAEANALWPQMVRSSTFRAAAGLWVCEWTWLALTLERLAERATQGALLGVREEGQWQALALLSSDSESLYVGYADGSGEALTHLARALAQQAKRTNRQYTVAMLPPVPAILSAFRQAGYSASGDGASLYIYGLCL